MLVLVVVPSNGKNRPATLEKRAIDLLDLFEFADTPANAFALLEQGIEAELNGVITAPADAIPEERPEMEAEQRKAKDLLAKTADLFAN